MHFFSLIFLITFFFLLNRMKQLYIPPIRKKKKSSAYLNAQIEACLDMLCSFFFPLFPLQSMQHHSPSFFIRFVMLTPQVLPGHGK